MGTPREAGKPKQRTDEWEHLDETALKYHAAQWDVTKQSTLAFADFARKRVAGSRSILDLASGAGAATSHLAREHPAARFTGLDYSAELVTLSNRLAQERGIANLSFRKGDWYHLEKSSDFDGVISLQTLSWLPDYEAPLVEIFTKLAPNWIGLTSLFYEGDITCRIEVEEHKRKRKSFYNVYSLPAIGRLCEAHQYCLAKAIPFRISIDLEKPRDADVMGTYTRKVTDSETGEVERWQISGPLLMSWYMVLIEKNLSAL